MTAIYDFHAGDTPLIISIPHSGILVPAPIAGRFSNGAGSLPDTDWYVDRLYASARDLGATVLKANYSRYVIDLNRDPEGGALYPGRFETPVCPLQTFAQSPIYQKGREPGAAEVMERVAGFWRPYHDKLQQTLQEVKARHGRALLWDAHSIRSQVPSLFEGKLPDFNFGTADGASCPLELGDRLISIVSEAGDYSAVLNGRFKGGYITRHYGRPLDGISAIQLELVQSAYMDENDNRWRSDAARRTAAVIRRLLSALLQYSC